MSIRTASQIAQARAAQSGAGIALVPPFVSRLEPSLQAITLEHEPPDRELWLTTRRQYRKESPLAVVVDFLTKFQSRKADLFASRGRRS
jgi:DNA-binding transcriptional LysR family regulator